MVDWRIPGCPEMQVRHYPDPADLQRSLLAEIRLLDRALQGLPEQAPGREMLCGRLRNRLEVLSALASRGVLV